MVRPVTWWLSDVLLVVCSIGTGILAMRVTMRLSGGPKEPSLRPDWNHPPRFPIPPSTGLPAVLQGTRPPYRSDAGPSCPHCGAGLSIGKRGES